MWRSGMLQALQRRQCFFAGLPCRCQACMLHTGYRARRHAAGSVAAAVCILQLTGRPSWLLLRISTMHLSPYAGFSCHAAVFLQELSERRAAALTTSQNYQVASPLQGFHRASCRARCC